MTNILIKDRCEWLFPPTTNRRGIATRGPNDIKEIILMESNLVRYIPLYFIIWCHVEVWHKNFYKKKTKAVKQNEHFQIRQGI